MATGKVKFYEDNRGFGFIIPDDGGEDVFVHARQVRRSGLYTLDAGQVVDYDLVIDRNRGDRQEAANLRS